MNSVQLYIQVAGSSMSQTEPKHSHVPKPKLKQHQIPNQVDAVMKSSAGGRTAERHNIWGLKLWNLNKGILRPSAGRQSAKVGRIAGDEIWGSVRARSPIPHLERKVGGERSIAQHTCSHQVCRHLSRTFFPTGRRAQEHVAPHVLRYCFRVCLIFPL